MASTVEKVPAAGEIGGSVPVSNPFEGRTIRHFQVIEKIGGGGMGVVYRARDTRLKRDVALKFLPARLSSDEEARRRFVREATAASALDHPNICTIYDVDETADGQIFISMAYVPGETLGQKIARGPLPNYEALDYVDQVARALARAHEHGIVHRDVKPGNVIVTPDGTAKLLDFGLAKLASGSRLTRTGAITGTVAYMSPEQIRGDDVDGRTDVWSLGVVAYEALAGRRPFGGEHEQAVAYNILNKSPEPLQSVGSEPGIEEAILTALEKDLTRRHPDMEAFRTALSSSMRTTPRAHFEESVLVLPFNDVSPDRDNAYFSDGITEELISGLSQIRSLRVICRTSAWHARASNKDLATLRKELNVQYVLEGSVRKVGNRIRVTPQLIDASTQTTLWSKNYDGTLDDVFDIQDRVARATIDSLRLRLSREEVVRLANRPIQDVHAYECFFRARQEIMHYTPEALERAHQHLRNGIEIVGENAVLYAGVAYVHWTYANLGIEREVNLSKARSYAEKIFGLEPDSAHGYRLLGLISALEGDYVKAVRLLEQAARLDLNDPETLQWLVILYGYVGKTDSARPLVDRLTSIDPLNPVSHAQPGWLYFMGGRFDLAIEPYRKMYRMDPDNPAYLFVYGLILAYNDLRAECFEILDKLTASSPAHPYAWMSRCFKHALSGQHEEMYAAVTPELRQFAEGDLSHSWFLADCYALVGNRDEAIAWLEKAVSLGFINYPFLSTHDSHLEGVRNDPRFQKLMHEIKREWEAL